MLTLLLSVKIFYVSLATVSSICHVPVAYGCYAYPPVNTIYISNRLILQQREYITYHEIGHYLYKDTFKDREEMANSFYFFMKAQSGLKGW